MTLFACVSKLGIPSKSNRNGQCNRKPMDFLWPPNWESLSHHCMSGMWMFQRLCPFLGLVVIFSLQLHAKSPSQSVQKNIKRQKPTESCISYLQTKMITAPTQGFETHPGLPPISSKLSIDCRPRAVVSVHSHHRCNMRRRPTRSFQWWLMGFGPVNFRLINLCIPIGMYFLKLI